MTEHTPIGQVKRAIGHKLTDSGYANVRVNDQEVVGGKGSVWVSVADFHIKGPDFWEVVMASGNTNDETRTVLNDAVTRIKSIQFFDWRKARERGPHCVGRAAVDIQLCSKRGIQAVSRIQRWKR